MLKVDLRKLKGIGIKKAAPMKDPNTSVAEENIEGIWLFNLRSF